MKRVILLGIGLLMGSAAFADSYEDAKALAHSYSQKSELGEILNTLQGPLPQLRADGPAQDDLYIELHAQCSAYKFGAYVSTREERDLLLGYVKRQMEIIDTRIEKHRQNLIQGK